MWHIHDALRPKVSLAPQITIRLGLLYFIFFKQKVHKCKFLAHLFPSRGCDCDGNKNRPRLIMRGEGEGTILAAEASKNPTVGACHRALLTVAPHPHLNNSPEACPCAN